MTVLPPAPAATMLAVAALMATLAGTTTAAAAAMQCPGSIAAVDTFSINGTAWLACEDLQQPGGSIVLVSSKGDVEWFSKSFEPYHQGSDDNYYLNLTKQAAITATSDLLGIDILSKKYAEVTWDLVAAAVPPIQTTGVRAFVGSRGSVTDTTFNDAGEGAYVGTFPPALTYVFNLTNIAQGGKPLPSGLRQDDKTLQAQQRQQRQQPGQKYTGGNPPASTSSSSSTNHPADGEDADASGNGLNGPPLQYINRTLMAAGIVGGHLPITIFYYPVVKNSTFLPSNANPNGNRYWTMVASGAPDMKGSREQTVWFRFQQIECAEGTDYTNGKACAQIGEPQYWDTFWWTNFPGSGKAADSTGGGGGGGGPTPLNKPTASGFYQSLLENREWWDNELANEGMMEVSLPDKLTATNGTYLKTQMTNQLIGGMLTWLDTWGPRYGVLPGYGIQMQNGFEDTFTGTAMGALEIGAMPYSKGLLNNQFNNYVRDDGLINYRAEEVAQSSRMLTILATYYSYSDDASDAAAFLLTHYTKAKAMADWLIARRASTMEYGTNDPRYGIIPGLDEGDNYKTQILHATPAIHFYSAAAEAYRAFAELGEVWVAVGAAAGRADVTAHGQELLQLAPLLYRDLHASMAKTVNTTASPGHRCYPHRADGVGTFVGCPFRSYPELFHSGALTAQQTDDIYTSGQGVTTCEVGRWLTLGTASGSNANPLIFTHVPQGIPFGLLVHDMVDRFLLYFFSISAHTATRDTWITPESQTIKREGGGYAYESAGMANVQRAMKLMLCFEEPETRTLWLGKATPRDWLAVGEAPVMATKLTTRYGRVSYTMMASTGGSGKSVAAAAVASAAAAATYTVHANVTLPATFATAKTAPVGGLRIRIRAPVEHAGKMSSVTVGGKPWKLFTPAEESVDIPASQLTADLIKNGLPKIVATFAASTPVALKPAHFDPSQRVVPVAPPAARTTARTARTARTAVRVAAAPSAPSAPSAPPTTTTTSGPPPACPGGITQVDTFEINGTAWAACEDLQQPGGSIVLVSGSGQVEWFSKTYSAYGTSASDSKYYLGLGNATVAAADTDILGAKLLTQKAGLTWADVESAIPPLRTSGHGGQWGNDCKGIRTFVGSRGSAFDRTMDDTGNILAGDDWDTCLWLMRTDTIAIQQYNAAIGAPKQTYDAVNIGEALVGGVLPTAFFVLPMFDNGTSKFRYWTNFVVPVADERDNGQQNREQFTWSRYQQMECSGPEMKPPCKLITAPAYWDSYWFSRYVGANATDAAKETLRAGPVDAASASGFYQTLLENRKYWDAELANEGMMEVSLPSPASTNGTWLATQATHAIVKSMITRESKWHPRSGLHPGYGYVVNNGLQEVFTATATAALEMGALPYAKGVIDNQFQYYIRDDGMVWHQSSSQIPASARALTILALYHSYSGDDGTFALQHFAKAKALAEMLISRRALSLQYGESDSRYGIPVGNDDALYSPANPGNSAGAVAHEEEEYWYGSAAELYRAFTELGATWTEIGAQMKRDDVAAHGKELLALAPLIYQQLQASLKMTATAPKTLPAPAPAAPAPAAPARCWPMTAVPYTAPAPIHTPKDHRTSFRGYAEMLYSGAMTAQQVSDIYSGASGSACGNRTLIVGSPAINGDSLATVTPYGLAYGLLQHDMVEPFLLHYFAMSAHSYTRSSWTTPEFSNVVNRDVPAGTYVAAGEVIAPTYLKWMLCFEEPETRTLWLGKATPRDWLAVGEAPLVANNMTTRYGRVSYTMRAVVSNTAADASAAGYAVRASVVLPASFATAKTAPNGGLRIRIRSPAEHKGLLSAVTVGGKPWKLFTPADETIDVPASQLTADLITNLESIVATYK